MSISNNNSNNKKTIFVTVGTTQFDKLIDAVTSNVALQWMQEQGYSNLMIQYGKGKQPNNTSNNYDVLSSSLPINNNNNNNNNHETNSNNNHHTVNITSYDFQSSLQADMEVADLIISHAGAGTIMEALRMQKTLIVVVNTDLMNNHQTELALAMHTRHLLWMVEAPERLYSLSTWKDFQNFVPQRHEDGDEYAFPRMLDAFLGYDTTTTTPTTTATTKNSSSSSSSIQEMKKII